MWKQFWNPGCDNIDIEWYWDCTSCGSWPIPSLCCRGAWIWQVLYWDNRSVKQTVSSMGKRTNNYFFYATHVPMAFFVPVQVHSAKFHDRKFGPLRCDKLSSCSNWSWEGEVTRHTRLAVSGVKRSKLFFVIFPHLNFASWRCRGGLSSLRRRAKVQELASSSSAWRPSLPQRNWACYCTSFS